VRRGKSFEASETPPNWGMGSTWWPGEGKGGTIAFPLCCITDRAFVQVKKGSGKKRGLEGPILKGSEQPYYAVAITNGRTPLLTFRKLRSRGKERLPIVLLVGRITVLPTEKNNGRFWGKRTRPSGLKGILEPEGVN